MSDIYEEGDAHEVGYKRPPQATRFPKGRSGNPKGRPQNRHRQLPYDTLLGQMVTIREDGRERRVTAAEAFLLQLTRKGLQGDSAAARSSLAAIETARASRSAQGLGDLLRVVIIAYGVGMVLDSLGLAVKHNRFDEDRVRWELKPWIIEAALGRLGHRVLSEAEQREVWDVTYRPQTVSWPKWWTYMG